MRLLVDILVALPELVLHWAVRKGTGQSNVLTPGDFSYSVKMPFPGVHFKSPSHVGMAPLGFLQLVESFLNTLCYIPP